MKAFVIAALNGCTGSNCLSSPSQLHLPTTSFGATAGNIVNLLLVIAGIVSVIFIVIGGINFITSDGDPKKAASARMTVTYAVAGLVLAITARVLVGFILSRAPH
jgi:ABC-type sulfate transport system permease component